MNRAVATLFALATLASPAAATGEILCMHPAGASIDLVVGRSPPLFVDGAVIIVGDDVWTTRPQMEPRGTTITVGQSFEDDHSLMVDLMDEDKANLVAKLRVLHATEGDQRAAGGVLQVAGRGAWAVDCAEPE